MRQVMPHRNNIGVRSLNCKIFLSEPTEIGESATFLPHCRRPQTDAVAKFLILNNGLYMLQMFTGHVPPLFRHS
jgi:hypothetical protein